MMTSSESPSWLDRDKIDEVLFCEELRAEHPMLCIHEVFFLFHKAHRVYLISVQGKLHKLCEILDCKLDEVAEYVPEK